MAVLGFRRSTAKTWPICSAQPYGPVLHVSRNLFSFCFCFYLWCCFLSFYIGWILDLPGIEIYSICPPQDSCRTASLAKIFFSCRPGQLRRRSRISIYESTAVGWLIVCVIQFFLNLFLFCLFFFFLKTWNGNEVTKIKRKEKKEKKNLNFICCGVKKENECI
jgi:hypothetical protein